MYNRIKRYFILLLVGVTLLFGSISVLALDLNTGVISRGRDTVATSEERQASRIMKPIIKSNNEKTYSRGMGYTNLGQGNIWYRLTRDLKIHIVDLDKQFYAGNYQLNRWPTEYKDKAISDLYEHHYIYSERSHELYDQYYSANPTTSGSSKAVGCLGEQPLRYGDIDDNGTKEIVLYLSDFNNKSDWIIFSPEKEKIIFSMRWQVRDYYDDMGETPHFQYPSEADQRSYNQGFQVYAKAFLGDFNKDKIPDILVWRKRFESLATGVSKKGFELKGEHFEHYSLVDGEYQPQVTIPLQIKDWLADAELTWSKGYPSKSECAGQEGQLIPEMHDPLLNDPDVLK
jgi:hypothetical protein